jgi:acyl-CoA dehydrogenase
VDPGIIGRGIKERRLLSINPSGEVELRDSQVYLLGKAEQGIYLILETLNNSRTANCIGNVALMQRAMVEVIAFAQKRVAFGKPVAEHPLLRRQIKKRFYQLKEAFALAWETVRLLDTVWQETPRYSERYHRLASDAARQVLEEIAAQVEALLMFPEVELFLVRYL